MFRKIFAAVVALAFLYIVSPLLLPVIMGGVLAVLFSPMLERLEKHKVSPSLGSAILTFAITLVILIPFSTLIYFGAKVGVSQLQSMKDAPRQIPDGDWTGALTGSTAVQKVLKWLNQWLPLEMEGLIEGAQDVLRAVGARVGDLLGAFVASLPGLALGIVIIVVSIYFFLIDGRKLLVFFRRSSFFTVAQTDRLITTLGGACRSVILAAVVSGACQAIFELIVLFATGIPNAMVIGMVVFLTSFIPVIGTAPVTFGVAIYQLLEGHTVAGFVLLGSAAIVTTMDNVIRPMFLKGSANIHPLLAFVAAFGGLQTLGFSGIFLGPIVAALLIVTLQILSDESSAP